MTRRLATIVILTACAAAAAQAIPTMTTTTTTTTMPATTQGDLPTPAEVIARYVSVCGGETAFASLKSRRAVGTFALPDLGITGSVTTLLRADGHALITIDVPGIGVVRQGMSDGVVWSIHPTDGPKILAGVEAETSRRSFALAPETTLDGYREASVVARVDINGRPANEMVLVSDAGVKETRFYDVDTGLLVKSIGVIASDAGELTVTTFYSDYEDATPIRIPMKVRQTMSGVSPEQTMTKVEHNVDLPDALFALPPEIVALQKQVAADAAIRGQAVSDERLLDVARQVIDVEATAVARMRDAIDDHFGRAIALVVGCRGALLLSGVGKAGHVARKLAATFASTGTPAHFLSAGDATHGDVGAVREGDVILLLSASGETDEILRLLSIVKKLNHPVIAITATRDSSLGRFADVAIATGRIEEACPLRLAPSASTTAMLALGDALALSVMTARDFTADDFAVFHPAGQLGRKLIRVAEAMSFKIGENLPVASERLTVGEVLADVSRIKRRSGAVVLVDDAGKLSGIFSDGDLRRLVERDPRGAMQTPVADVMTRGPKHIRADALASEAIAIMRPHRIDELPVVDDVGRPIGIIDVQDLVVLKMFDVDQKA